MDQQIRSKNEKAIHFVASILFLIALALAAIADIVTLLVATSGEDRRLMFTKKYYTRSLSGLIMLAGSVSVFLDRLSKEGWGIIFTGIFLFFCSFAYRRYKATRPVKRGKDKTK